MMLAPESIHLAEKHKYQMLDRIGLKERQLQIFGSVTDEWVRRHDEIKVNLFKGCEPFVITVLLNLKENKLE